MVDELARFPDASDFSPGIIAETTPSGGKETRLRLLLKLIQQGGTKDEILERVRSHFFATSNMPLRRANNVLIALNQNNYALVDSATWELTPAGVEVVEATSEEEALAQFVRHIIRELAGQDLLRAIRSIQSRGERPSKGTLTRELALIGYAEASTTSTNETRMANWLQTAGVLHGYELDDQRLLELAGVSIDDIEMWADELDAPQRAFLREVRRLAITAGGGEIAVDDIRDLVETRHGEVIWRRRDQIPADVIYPLADAGWLVRPEHAGRGARAGTTKATQKLLDLELGVLDVQVREGLPAAVRRQLQTPLSDLRERLDSDDRHVSGLALEVLLARIAIELGLTGIRLRERAAHTGASEVDVIGEQLGRTFSRWVIQCKNTRSASGVEILTREIGVAFIMGATVVVLVSRGGFSEDLKTMAAETARRTHLQVVLIDGRDLNRYFERGVGAIADLFERQAKTTAERKGEYFT